MILADLHVHSQFSDGKLSIAELVDFYGSRGFGAIAITDHICEKKTFFGRAASALSYSLTKENFPAYLETIRREGERAWDQYKLQVIPGFELSKNSWFHHRSAHILGIGVSQWIEAEADILEMTRGLRAQGALAIAAHPVNTRIFEPQTLHLWSRREELRHEFDAWEVASGPHFFDEVAKSGLPMIATSDLHHPKQIKSWKTILDVRPSTRFSDDPQERIEAILEAVRQQRVEFRFWNEQSGVVDHNQILTKELAVS